MTDIEPDDTVDARGAACPGPLMDLIGAIRDAEPGDVVRLLSDSEQSLTDVPEWAEEAGNELLATEELEDHYELYVEKA
ncbi:sulfurtransferase TusA family protein [Haloarcula sp. 1CSR25-25]|jgi:TusA-related sulfurtransferase|uniref:sulfurtransferase TusA family protein n=1 Tax=Haloarcula sp. 1CSR25-25 TaxID=2862545 RepID=UPI002894093A|nr:sulfurtransferase TusA family protein [Haloarcula sp. 1CSR25-25]MDT3437933.1 sulfurtransferase TusA family protein [Haloarcula sp. 1CSR25-25]